MPTTDLIEHGGTVRHFPLVEGQSNPATAGAKIATIASPPVARL
jgi:hypothetical protein